MYVVVLCLSAWKLREPTDFHVRSKVNAIGKWTYYAALGDVMPVVYLKSTSTVQEYLPSYGILEKCLTGASE
jgi:hypothetical protein